mmetsp:Transcript_131173/g.311117  ORF Transcript_131173/g.311117 Transcript_131173/m.311117 type:complete len:228 (+) Transcript_131173:472-1155(+)
MRRSTPNQQPERQGAFPAGPGPSGPWPAGWGCCRHQVRSKAVSRRQDDCLRVAAGGERLHGQRCVFGGHRRGPAEGRRGSHKRLQRVQRVLTFNQLSECGRPECRAGHGADLQESGDGLPGHGDDEEYVPGGHRADDGLRTLASGCRQRDSTKANGGRLKESRDAENSHGHALVHAGRGAEAHAAVRGCRFRRGRTGLQQDGRPHEGSGGHEVCHGCGQCHGPGLRA